MSGYDIRVSLGSINWLIDVPSYGSLYPALHSLREEGLVNVSIVPNDGKPSRKVYSITAAGSRALEAWSHRPAEADISQKAFVMRLLLANSFSSEQLSEYLKQRYALVTARCSELERSVKRDTIEVGSEGDRLALDYGLAIANAEIAWLKATLARFPGAIQEGKQSIKSSAHQSVELKEDYG